MKRLHFALISLLIILFVSLSCSKKIKSPLASYDGVEMNFIEKGNGEVTLLFIHGWGNNYSIWDRQIEHFSKNNRVVAVDLPGFGKSGSNRQNWSISAFGKDIHAIIDKLQLENVVLVGFSLGAGVAVECAKGDKNAIAGVIIVDNLQNIELTYEPQTITYMDSVYMDLVLNPTKEKMLGGGFFKKNPDESYNRILTMLNDNTKIGWSNSLKGYLNWLNNSCIEAIKNISVPIISINSDAVPTNVEAFEKYARSYQLKTVSDTGHVIMWDQTDEFNQLLEESIQEIFE